MTETDANKGRKEAGSSAWCHSLTRGRSTRDLDAGSACQTEDLHRSILGPMLNGMRWKQCGRRGGTPSYPHEVRMRGGIARITAPTLVVQCRRPCFFAGHRGGLEGAISLRHTEEVRGERRGASRRLCAARRGGYGCVGARPGVSRLPGVRGGGGEEETTM